MLSKLSLSSTVEVPVSNHSSPGNLTRIIWEKMLSVLGALASTKAFIPNSLNFNVIEQPIEFFTLPAEIRNAIYCQILVSRGPICEADRLVGVEGIHDWCDLT